MSAGEKKVDARQIILDMLRQNEAMKAMLKKALDSLK